MSSKTSKLTPTPASATAAKPKSELRPPGVIEPGCLLTVPEVRARLGLGAWAWRSLRRAGLRTIRVAGRGFVLSDDVIAHFRREAEEPET